jgi:hypothetical protein
LEKQAILCDISRKLGQLGPLQESVETLSRNLNHVKSDITTDKTVCEVSGNFMSARDADTRIASHYAGKQYVGWKLVREKFKEMHDLAVAVWVETVETIDIVEAVVVAIVEVVLAIVEVVAAVEDRRLGMEEDIPVQSSLGNHQVY